MKQIPYGIDDFDVLIKENYYYIDKTMHIKTVEEQNSYILFVRPRRMGKSLFTNMLMSYYDIAKKNQFEDLFGNLWIGQNPTAWASKFMVLKFDFSKVGSDMHNLGTNFSNYCFGRIRDFLDKYSNFYPPEEKAIILNRPSIKECIVTLVERSKLKGLPPIYLFIDEYDNFSNVVLSARGVRAHQEITHGEGFYRNFFKACKGSFRRIFMSGVAPVTYDDLTSGFNIADVVALLPQFDQTVGVNETELRTMIDYYRKEGKISRTTDEVITEMKPWYDNFCFCDICYGTQPPIYNTDMVMRYLNTLIKTGNSPADMVDRNARTDYQKLDYLVISEDLEHREERIGIIKEICAKGCTYGSVNEQFSASSCGDEANFKSMLYYFGTLTFGGKDNRGLQRLIVPNKNMGELYLQYMLRLIDYQGYSIGKDRRNVENAIYEAAYEGDWQPLIQQIGICYKNYSSIRNSIRGEADIQGFLRGLLCLNDCYDLWPELELGHGYCDILLVPKKTQLSHVKYSYLIEIKYVKKDSEGIESYVEDAIFQLDKYATDLHMHHSALLGSSTLNKLYLIFQNQNLVASSPK